MIRIAALNDMTLIIELEFKSEFDHLTGFFQPTGVIFT